MKCIKCHGHGYCADEVLGVQEQWMCERCNGSGEEPYADWQAEQDRKMYDQILKHDVFLGFWERIGTGHQSPGWLLFREQHAAETFREPDAPFIPRFVYSCVTEMVDPEGFKLRIKPRYFEEL